MFPLYSSKLQLAQVENEVVIILKFCWRLVTVTTFTIICKMVEKISVVCCVVSVGCVLVLASIAWLYQLIELIDKNIT